MLLKPFGGSPESQEAFLLDRLLITSGVLVIAGMVAQTSASRLVFALPLLFLSYVWGWGIWRNMRGVTGSTYKYGREGRHVWRRAGEGALFLLFGPVIGLMGMVVGTVWLALLRIRRRHR